MKRIALTTLALTLAAGTTFAMPHTNSQQQNGVQNSYSRIAPGAVLPQLTPSQLALISAVLNDSDSNNAEKRSRVEFYVGKFAN
ncbi:hypothetical protein [Halovulum sp. GXIMD14793]